MKNNSLTSVSDRYMSYVWYDDRQEVLLLPLLFYVWGLLKQAPSFLALASLSWMAGYAIWCLWTLWKVSERFPAEDNWRAVAVLVYGGTAWVLTIPLVIALRGNLSLELGFPLVYVAGCWALLSARRRGVNLPAAHRVWLVGGAAAISLLWVIALAFITWFMFPRSRLGAADDGSLPVAVISALLLPLAGFLAVQLFRSARKGYTPHRPLTAESLLAD